MGLYLFFVFLLVCRPVLVSAFIGYCGVESHMMLMHTAFRSTAVLTLAVSALYRAIGSSYKLFAQFLTCLLVTCQVLWTMFSLIEKRF